MSTENAVPVASGAGGRPRTAATLILASIGAFVTSLDGGGSSPRPSGSPA
jgi:hypothetical protein